VIAKFHDFSDGVIGATRAGQIVDLVYALKTVETAFADLRELVLSGVE
jgi:hypothetical protein